LPVSAAKARQQPKHRIKNANLFLSTSASGPVSIRTMLDEGIAAGAAVCILAVLMHLFSHVEAVG
jgi:hypothetical protein